jgi:hypothetical protein
MTHGHSASDFRIVRLSLGYEESDGGGGRVLPEMAMDETLAVIFRRWCEVAYCWMGRWFAYSPDVWCGVESREIDV